MLLQDSSLRNNKVLCPSGPMHPLSQKTGDLTRALCFNLPMNLWKQTNKQPTITTTNNKETKTNGKTCWDYISEITIAH